MKIINNFSEKGISWCDGHALDHAIKVLRAVLVIIIIIVREQKNKLVCMNIWQNKHEKTIMYRHYDVKYRITVKNWKKNNKFVFNH